MVARCTRVFVSVFTYPEAVCSFTLNLTFRACIQAKTEQRNCENIKINFDHLSCLASATYFLSFKRLLFSYWYWRQLFINTSSVRARNFECKVKWLYLGRSFLQQSFNSFFLIVMLPHFCCESFMFQQTAVWKIFYNPLKHFSGWTCCLKVMMKLN